MGTAVEVTVSKTDVQPPEHDPGIRELRDAIPAHCFESSYTTSFYYVARDLAIVAALALAALHFIPSIPSPVYRFVAWAIYGFTQGLVGTGLWVLAHECGHGAFSPNQRVNDVVGWLLHSALLTPYFSWKSTHRRHHMYANHMERDHHYVPLRRDTYAAKVGTTVENLEHLTEDVPIVTFLRIIVQQIFGWPWYVLFNITSGPESTFPRKRGKWFKNSHIDPTSSLFSPHEFGSIVLSDIGLGLTAFGLWHLGNLVGSRTTIYLYVVPYLWVNHWIVAATYLHHTHPSVPRYEGQSWTFLRGALATVDRDVGWIGRFFFHNIIDYHVIHHIFPRIPFYHAEEATNAIRPLLGPKYIHDKPSSFMLGLWQAFTECQWVESDKTKGTESGALWFKGGPSPAPEYSMRSWRTLPFTNSKVWM
ncbi:hypothetical protein UREG_02885 [Uncinocarpus reesii 1704]|uniref:Fatty acid desaturase domain-containing protein n=1 Tax=Uncinocarpus reesii (strain UAMH 1704) TaxID=336963 RepID=C4JIM4_UNCRE|nr:uncharacterized protein UREG_02885 [Uncinocarpus reesii 1704]EEP78036.1 hypothetical protein UREG_02885 [Uncinocarpus reesii 1704]